MVESKVLPVLDAAMSSSAHMDEQSEANSNQANSQNEETPPRNERKVNVYEKISHDLSNDKRCLKEITLGKRIGFYRIRGELGTGNFSQVKMGIHSLTKEKVAIKILDKTRLDQKTQRLLSREISSMEKLHHPNIIRLYEVVETLAKLHIVMEYASGGELFTKISNEGRLPETEAKSLFAQIVAAVQHMHDLHIIHRDLKAENVFFAGPRTVKIGDLGFSTFSRSDQTLNTFCGSPPYAAPELFKDESYYGGFVDIWALGIMLYFMVTGIMPFRAETVAKLKKCILDGVYTIPVYVSDSCHFLIRNILKPVPQDRFKVPEIKNSDWLEAEEMPGALQPYQLNPSQKETHLQEEEVEARNYLRDLGITDEHVKQASGKDSRSSITGAYRIILHKIHKKNSNIEEFTEENHTNRQHSNSYSYNTGKDNHTGRGGINGLKKESRLCTLL